MVWHAIPVRSQGPQDFEGCRQLFDIQQSGTGKHLWIHSDESSDPYVAAYLVHKLLKEFRPQQYWSLTYACVCDKPRVGEFTGGAFFVTAKKIYQMSAYEFVTSMTRKFENKLKKKGS